MHSRFAVFCPLLSSTGGVYHAKILQELLFKAVVLCKGWLEVTGDHKVDFNPPLVEAQLELFLCWLLEDASVALPHVQCQFREELHRVEGEFSCQRHCSGHRCFKVAIIHVYAS